MDNMTYFRGIVMADEKDRRFTCYNCKFSASFNYFGLDPPFVKNIVLMEKSYVMKDPFSSDGGLINLGSHCNICGLSICCSQECSLFYTKRFCLKCVVKNIEDFPVEIQQEVLRKHQKDPD